MKILHLDSSIFDNDSISRELSSDVVRYLEQVKPDSQVTYRDLVKHEVRHLTAEIAAGFRNTGITQFDAATLQEHQRSQELVTEFLAHDIIVIGAPMYNFSIPTQLKAWMDRIAQVGTTFKYTEQGPVGLAGGRTIIITSARGGFYSQGPMAKMDFQESYLEAFFGFLGIKQVYFVRAEGASKGETIRTQELCKAIASVSEIVDSVISQNP